MSNILNKTKKNKTIDEKCNIYAKMETEKDFHKEQKRKETR